MEDDLLTFIIVVGPEHGVLSLAGGFAEYTPRQGYFGPDSFTFQAFDGESYSNIAMISITVIQNPRIYLPVLMNQ